MKHLDFLLSDAAKGLAPHRPGLFNSHHRWQLGVALGKS